jgi:spore maturation protein CgeB
MITNEDCNKKRIYIIGKTINLTQRLSNYNKSSEHEVVYYRSCNNIEDMTIIESLVLNKLKIYREQANRDRFILPLNNDIKLFTNIIDDIIKFIIPTV